MTDPVVAGASTADAATLPRVAVVAPTYNNAQTLAGVLDRLAALALPMIVVNDGSTDATAAILSDWASRHPQARLDVRTHPVNRGKAAALHRGFAAARAAGFTHAATIDTDGQLAPEEIPALLERSRANPRALVIGVRDDTASDYPARSRVGRRLSNLMVRFECGLRVADSQCGLRVYPLDLVERAGARAGYFGYETEVITRAGWAGFEVVGTPVSCRYLPPGERVSHFRPWRDTFRGIGMHARLMGRALLPWPVRGRRDDGADDRLRFGRAWRDGLAWLNPARAWRQVREGGAGRADFAAGFAIGVFIANLPLYGVQTVLSLYVARRLHLHPLSVVAGSQVSSPPVGPLLIAGAIGLGHLMLHGSTPDWSDFDPSRSGWAGLLGPLLIEWMLGAVVLGGLLAALAYVLADWACRAVRVAGAPRDEIGAQGM